MDKEPLKIILFLLFISFYIQVFSQSNLLFLPINETGETYVRASFRTQMWVRYLETNPGTTMNGDPLDDMVDFSLRRIRVALTAQLTPKLYIFSMWGTNNLNITREKDLVIDLLDYTVEYTFHEAFALGFGENAWSGPSRLTTRSTRTLMAVDAPLFSLFTVNKNDNLSRLLGIYSKGQIGKFDYVLSLQSPSNFGVEAKEGVVDYAINKGYKRPSAYVKYEFLENESNKTAFSGGTGTYLGSKRIFNIGAGIVRQKNMMWQLENGVERTYDYKNWAVDAFFDAPLNKNKNNAITSYLGFFNTDFGPDYIRNVGANDITMGGTSFNGSGNDFPMMGTGQTYFFQFGYLMKKGLFGERQEQIQMQPNIAFQYSIFDGLGDPMAVTDLGVNVYFKGYDNKMTLSYQSRPVYELNSEGVPKYDQRKGSLILQYQVSIN